MSLNKIIVMLGAPGAGKGTQARKLQEKFSLPQISTGDILRQIAKENTPLGSTVREIQALGKLVGDDVLLELVTERTNKKDCTEGFVLDGYPRTLNQAKQLSLLAKKHNKPVFVIEVKVSEEILLNRLTGRRTCSGCGEIYNIYYKPPKHENKCDICESSLTNRSDDKLEAIKSRLEEYKANTAPLIDYYTNINSLISVDGTKLSSEIFDELCCILKS
ncbi:MAG: adenylate kinase [Blastocatellia bacterium]|nr:adenylate kinase [Blastocatellia bacterium]